MTRSQPTYRENWNARREIATSAAFFAPYVQPGMRLLDCGCGPGSLTLDFAEAIAPGEVIGVDNDERVLDRARAAAAERGTTNVSFQLGNIYQLELENESVDAVWTSSLMQWLDKPVKALREVLRVLKPGGVYASRDRDRGGDIFGNGNRLVGRALNLHYWQNELATGGSFHFGGRLRGLMLKAGFEKVTTGASYENHGDREGAQFIVGLYDRALREEIRPWSVKIIKEQGWADDEELARLIEAWKLWGEDHRSFYAICRVENVGWKPLSGSSL